MAWDSTCSECTYIGVLGENKGKYPCYNPKSGQKVVSARRPKCDCFCPIGVSKRTTREARELEANSRKYGYFVVTAISQILSLDEDNMHIKAFAYLKDEVMPNVPEYQSFLEEYEINGPKVSEALLNAEDAYDYAEMLRVAYLEDVTELVMLEKPDEAITVFKGMYDILLDEFGIRRAVPKPTTLALK